MNYKETLFFIGKCLTINHEEKNKKIIESKLISDEIDWDSVVKVSTSHFVFPALYCNLKRANFLHYLPEELVNYMIHITDLNRERNQQIIEQAKEINELLLENNITPIFLKGTGNLLEGLYEDIAERMVGDIDFLVSKEEYKKTIIVLKQNKYNETQKAKHPFPHTRHYARINKKNRIAAVEIHDQLIIKKYFKYFGYETTFKKILIVNKNEAVLSYNDQLCLSIISKHINDNGYLFKNISLRNSYDLFLLSKKTNAIKAINQLKPLKLILNQYLAISNDIFGNPKSLNYIKNIQTKNYLKSFYKQLNRKSKIETKLIKFYLKYKLRLSIIKQIVTKKEMRNWFVERNLSTKKD